MSQALFNLCYSVLQLIQNVGLEKEQIRGWCAKTIRWGKFEIIQIKRENLFWIFMHIYLNTLVVQEFLS